MRAVTATLIVMGIASLSCEGFGPASVDSPADAAAGIAIERSANAQEIATAQIHAELQLRHTALSDHELARLADTIVVEARRHQLEPTLVLAVIQVESRGNHLAVSPVGALGLMQLLPSTGEELARKHGLPWRGANSLFDPILNVKLGTAYLSQLSNKYGSVSTALAAYNWGPGRIDRRLRRGSALPRIYIEQVMKYYDAGTKIAPSSRS